MLPVILEPENLSVTENGTAPAEDEALSDANLAATDGMETFQYGNLELKLKSENSTNYDGIEVSVHDLNDVEVGTLSLTRLKDPFAAAYIIEEISRVASAGSVIESKDLREIFDRTVEYGGRIRSDLGRTMDEIVEGYSRAICSSPAREPSIRVIEIDKEKGASVESILDGSHKSNSSLTWIDIDLSIPDTASLRERFEPSLREIIPDFFGADAHPSMEGAKDYMYLDTRVFSEDLEDDCKVEGKKVGYFLKGNMLVSMHDGPIPTLDKRFSEIAALKAGDLRGVSTFSLFCDLFQSSLNQNEEELARLESIIDSVSSELEGGRSLAKHRVTDDIPELADSFRYIGRKLDGMADVQDEVKKALGKEGMKGVFGESVPERVLERIGELGKYVTDLSNKARHMLEQVKDISNSNTTLLSMQAAQGQMKVAVIQAVVLPVVFCATIAGLWQYFATPEVLAIIALGATMTAGLLITALKRRWL